MTMCIAEACNRPAMYKAKQVCQKHYFRLMRNGTLEAKEWNRRTDPCSVDGCERLGDYVGMCQMHYFRNMRNGDPEVLLGPSIREGEANNLWTGDNATYVAVHSRVKKHKGLARNFDCVDCGNSAYHWSYNHQDLNEKLDQKLGPYSLNIENYDPRCVKCHKKFDLEFLSRKVLA